MGQHRPRFKRSWKKLLDRKTPATKTVPTIMSLEVSESKREERERES